MRGTLTFRDGSKLEFLEYIAVENGNVERISYRLHYVGPDGSLIFRYDNAPHHREVATFPHHKHLANGKVVEATPTSLPEVLDEIAETILKTTHQARHQTRHQAT